jgi:hypothetical protein
MQIQREIKGGRKKKPCSGGSSPEHMCVRYGVTRRRRSPLIPYTLFLLCSAPSNAKEGAPQAILKRNTTINRKTNYHLVKKLAREVLSSPLYQS